MLSFHLAQHVLILDVRFADTLIFAVNSQWVIEREQSSETTAELSQKIETTQQLIKVRLARRSIPLIPAFRHPVDASSMAMDVSKFAGFNVVCRICCVHRL